MSFVASTLSEHLRHEGEVRGLKIGEKIGRLKGGLSILEELYDQGLIAKDVFEARAVRLRRDLAKALAVKQTR